MFDARGPMQLRNDRSGVLQRSAVRRVWVELAVMFPFAAAAPRSCPDPHGVDLSLRAPGELITWSRTTTGEWVGWGSVSIVADGEVRQVWTYLPAAALSPREEVERAADLEQIPSPDHS